MLEKRVRRLETYQETCLHKLKLRMLKGSFWKAAPIGLNFLGLPSNSAMAFLEGCCNAPGELSVLAMAASLHAAKAKSSFTPIRQVFFRPVPRGFSSRGFCALPCPARSLGAFNSARWFCCSAGLCLSGEAWLRMLCGFTQLQLSAFLIGSSTLYLPYLFILNPKPTSTQRMIKASI